MSSSYPRGPVEPLRRVEEPPGFDRRPAVRRRFFFSCFRSDDTEAFSCLKSDDFRQEGVFPNSLCHISDEMRHSPACSSHREEQSFAIRRTLMRSSLVSMILSCRHPQERLLVSLRISTEPIY